MSFGRLPAAMSGVRQLCWREAGHLVGVVWEASEGRDSVVECVMSVDREEGRVEVGDW